MAWKSRLSATWPWEHVGAPLPRWLQIQPTARPEVTSKGAGTHPRGAWLSAPETARWDLWDTHTAAFSTILATARRGRKRAPYRFKQVGWQLLQKETELSGCLSIYRAESTPSKSKKTEHCVLPLLLKVVPKTKPSQGVSGGKPLG